MFLGKAVWHLHPSNLRLYMQVKTPTSSITIMWTLSALATPFFIRSSSLPGVAITTCTKRQHKNTRGDLEQPEHLNMFISLNIFRKCRQAFLNFIEAFNTPFSNCWVICTGSHLSHLGAWCHLLDWFHQWWPWPLLPPCACSCWYRFGLPAEPILELAPLLWLGSERAQEREKVLFWCIMFNTIAN